jgi:uncharacterized repeat protein (TIGR03803 family)
MRRISSITLTIVTIVLISATAAWSSSKEKVLYSFPGGNDGDLPSSGLVVDNGGNLYGVAGGGTQNAGVVYKLTPGAGGAWTESVIYNFTGGSDGKDPMSDLVFDALGNLYGTTEFGGLGYGTVFKLAPNSDGTWTESVLYSFTGGSDGGLPRAAVIFDQGGNLYGTTSSGGSKMDLGTVFRLTLGSGGWTESVLYSFVASSDGYTPVAPLVFDKSGHLYGTTSLGGPNGGGVVFKLTPSSNGWKETILYGFGAGNEGVPYAGVTFHGGRLYGTVSGNGDGVGGVFELSHTTSGWTEKMLYAGGGPAAGVTFDKAGNLYSTTDSGGAHRKGTVFKLTLSNGTWTESTILTFWLRRNGTYPQSRVIIDKNGNLYGTTSLGGSYNRGSVYQVKP